MFMNIHIAIIFLAIIGVADCLYLNYERKRKRPPVCMIGHSCEQVWASPYSYTLGVSNEILGIIFYATAIAVEWSLFLGDTSFPMVFGEYLILSGGAVVSLYFVFLQWRIIRAWCFWCTLSAILTFSMLAIRLMF